MITVMACFQTIVVEAKAPVRVPVPAQTHIAMGDIALFAISIDLPDIGFLKTSDTHPFLL